VTLYEALLFGHVAAAIVWLGAAFVFALLVFGADRRRDRAKIAGYSDDNDWLAPRLYIPSSLATLLFGLLLVAEGSWSLDQLWIAVGLAGWLVSFLLGILFFKPETERMSELAAQRGSTDPELEARGNRMTVLERFELVVLFVVVADMVIKPTGDDTGLVVVGAALVAVAAAAAIAEFRRRGAAVAATARPAASSAR
jgi:uncharacterized membrane protein